MITNACILGHHYAEYVPHLFIHCSLKKFEFIF